MAINSYRRGARWRRQGAILYALVLAWVYTTGPAHAGFSTTIPVSEEAAGDYAGSLFPVSVALDGATLYLTNPEVLFLDSERIGIRLRVQAYDHRPAEGTAISETGVARVSGRPDYDRALRRVLLYDPRVEQLQFDRDNEASRHLLRVVRRAWTRDLRNPVSAELPPHPYLLPLRDHLVDIVYDGSSINLQIQYQ